MEHPSASIAFSDGADRQAAQRVVTHRRPLTCCAVGLGSNGQPAAPVADPLRCHCAIGLSQNSLQNKYKEREYIPIDILPPVSLSTPIRTHTRGGGQWVNRYSEADRDQVTPAGTAPVGDRLSFGCPVRFGDSAKGPRGLAVWRSWPESDHPSKSPPFGHTDQRGAPSGRPTTQPITPIRGHGWPRFTHQTHGGMRHESCPEEHR